MALPVLLALAIGALVGVLVYPPVADHPDPMGPVRSATAGQPVPGAPWSERILGWTGWTPRADSELARNLAIAGSRLTLADIYVCKGLLPAVFLLLAALALHSGETALGMGLLGAAAIAWRVPDRRIAQQANAVRSEIVGRLPAFLQALALMTEAGMHLKPALAAYVECDGTALGRELRQVLRETERNALLSDALMRMAERCDVQDLYRAVVTLVQAQERGAAGLAAACRVLAAEAWARRRDAARELAQQASAKMFLPLFLLVVPTLLLFMFGPAVIAMMSSF